jgi:alcohol dehydrogenase
MSAALLLDCPTRLLRDEPFDAAVEALVGGRPWALFTSSGWAARGAVARLRRRLGSTLTAVAEVEPNPSVAHIAELSPTLSEARVAVALGGGSVIDAAKAVTALRGLGGDDAALGAHLREGVPLPAQARLLPLIAVPTTAGTGSEITCWGSIWDGFTKRSVADGRLRPTHAVFDPELLTTMPMELTLAAGLDAAAHAMESVWNRRHAPPTDRLAEEALCLLREHLGASLAQPRRVDLRRELQLASLLSGVAMGTTQTALAHSLSYPFTARFHVPHGLACGFTLAEVARYNAAVEPDRLLPIARAFGCAPRDVPAAVEAWLDDLGVGDAIARYLSPESAEGLGDAFVSSTRAANNLRAAGADAALDIARAALRRFAGRRRSSRGERETVSRRSVRCPTKATT